MTDFLELKFASAKDILYKLLPHLRELFRKMTVQWDGQVKTAAVTKSGRLLLAPSFILLLNERQLAFVLAHELYHLIYKAFDRIPSEEDLYFVNIAHDCIINEMLFFVFKDNFFKGQILTEKIPSVTDDMDWLPPGLLTYKAVLEDILHLEIDNWEPIISGKLTLENFVALLKQFKNQLPKNLTGFRNWRIPAEESEVEVRKGSFIGHSLESLGNAINGGWLDLDGTAAYNNGNDDGYVELVDDGEGENTFYVNGSLIGLEEDDSFAADMEETTFNTAFTQDLYDSFSEVIQKACDGSLPETKGQQPTASNKSPHEAIYKPDASPYRISWEALLQSWLDETAPPIRSWSHASRRTGNREDIVMPGHRNGDNGLLNVILNTHVTMKPHFAKVLGMIISLANASGFNRIHLIQCDNAVTSDDYLDLDELFELKIRNFEEPEEPPEDDKKSENQDDDTENPPPQDSGNSGNSEEPEKPKTPPETPQTPDPKMSNFAPPIPELPDRLPNESTVISSPNINISSFFGTSRTVVHLPDIFKQNNDDVFYSYPRLYKKYRSTRGFKTGRPVISLRTGISDLIKKKNAKQKLDFSIKQYLSKPASMKSDNSAKTEDTPDFLQSSSDSEINPATQPTKCPDGNDLTEAMLLLAKDSKVENVLVLTDTHIGYPAITSVPYQVCWAVLDSASDFQPKYGRTIIIRMEK